MGKYSLIDHCPITGNEERITYFNLGNIPLVNNLNTTREESLRADRYPLQVNYFPSSGVSALECSIDGDLLFSNYLYKSEVNIPYYNHCKEMFKYIQKYVTSKNMLKIADIGGNDWSLLCAFREESKEELSLLNIDPSVNLTKISESKGIYTLVDFFSYEVAQKILDKYDIITSTNVFQHLKDIASFVQGIEFLLSEEGIRVLEFPYWIHSMETNQFDQVYHEHMYYHSATPLKALMEKYGLKIINITTQDIHGGSLRMIMTKKNSPHIPDETVETTIKAEEKYTLEYYKDRWLNIQRYINESKKFIKDIKAEGKTIYGFGAAAKGCIYLNAMGIDYTDIDVVIDDTDIKQGKFIPGTGIEIVSRDILKEKKPDYILILAHNFAEYIIKSLYHEYKGKFIILIPSIRIF